MRTSWLVVVLAGCGAVPTQPTSSAPPRAPIVPRAAYSVVAAELGDDGVLERIRHRVRVRFLRRVSPRYGTTDEPVIARTQASELDQILPVIDARGREIRVVAEDDDARCALWIDRADTWDTTLTGLELVDGDPTRSSGAGAWLRAGAPISAGTVVAGQRRVALRDDELELAGAVPAAVVGHVWVVTGDDPVATDVDGQTRWSDPPLPEGRTRTWLAPRTAIRRAPQVAAAAIARVLDDEVPASIVKPASRDGWAEVEVARPYVRLRGHVRATDLRGDHLRDLQGTGSGSGFGMSHADRLEIPAGTCLFDAPDGEVAGVQIAASTRLGRRKTDQAHWSRVYVDTPWNVVALYVRDTAEDPDHPVWESCRQVSLRR